MVGINDHMTSLKILSFVRTFGEEKRRVVAVGELGNNN